LKETSLVLGPDLESEMLCLETTDESSDREKVVQIRTYCSLPVDVPLPSSSGPKNEPEPESVFVSEKIEAESAGTDPNKELSDGICHEGRVGSGLR
jgi:hypothetical protein